MMNQILWTKDCSYMESFLEKYHHYRLNIHTRDFEIGRPIDSNIEEACHLQSSFDHTPINVTKLLLFDWIRINCKFCTKLKCP